MVSETYGIQDCWKYDGTEHTKSYDGSMTVETLQSFTDLTDYSLEVSVKTSVSNYHVSVNSGNNQDLNKIGYGSGVVNSGMIFRTLNGTNDNTTYGSQLTNYYNLRFEKTGTTLKTYLNDTLIDTSTDSSISNFKYLNIVSWASKTLYYKNLKIKPL